jgi:hypothetical protein
MGVDDAGGGGSSLLREDSLEDEADNVGGATDVEYPLPGVLDRFGSTEVANPEPEAEVDMNPSLPILEYVEEAPIPKAE